MLTGRESLSKLIGKRRRFLPNRQRLLSSPTQDSSFNSRYEAVANGAMQSKHELVKSKEDEVGASTFDATKRVSCPACGFQVPGGEYNINSHLDACLKRGIKRKTTQCTLLQFNFSKNKACTNETIIVHHNMLPKGPKPDDNHVHIHSRSEVIRVDEESDCCKTLPIYGTTECKSLKTHANNEGHSPLEPIMQYSADYLTENHIPNDEMSNAFDTSLSLRNDKLNLSMDETRDAISGTTLETYIVGRRYGDEMDIKSGASICLLRDYDNDKDPNAIKVVSENVDCPKLLGFLPRGLAQDLSSLIDNYGLIFQGTVTSDPNHSHEVVPIKIMCLEIPSYAENENVDFDAMRSLWNKVICSVDLAKKYPPNTAKYQQNFLLIMKEVLRSNQHLFTADEIIFLESFSSLSDDSQRLFVRLYMRKGPWFRMSNITYPEVLDAQEAANELSEAGYFCCFDSDDGIDNDYLKDVLNVLTVTELREILCLLKKKQSLGMKKQDIIVWLISSFKDGLCPLLLRLIVDRTGTCVCISSTAESLVWRLERLFFLSGEQDLSSFLLVDMGIVKYPEYKCIISDQIFPQRSDLLAYEEAIEVAQIMDQSLDVNDSGLLLQCTEISESRLTCASTMRSQSMITGSAAMFLQRFSASWVYSKALLVGVSFLECESRYKGAIQLLKQLLTAFACDRRRGYWILRLSIDLEHIGCLDESLCVAEDGLLDPWVRAGSRMALQRRVIRLAKPPRRWKPHSYAQLVKRSIPEVQVQGRPLNCKTGKKSRFYGEDGEQCGVEQLSLQYYSGEGGGWQGIHTEGGIWMTIFGLLLWDIIFADVPNVFWTKFQNAPIDLETDNFYAARKSKIESLLQSIEDGMAEAILIMSWESHFGTSCRGVNWEKHSLSELRAAVTCIGGPCLASLCRHLAQDYRSWSSGMPDLLLWRFHGGYKGEAKLVEVKGPRDILSDQQRAWLLVLMDCGFNIEVCKVRPAPPSS